MNRIKYLFKGKKELWKKIFKCAITYEVATIFILIPSVVKVAGSPPYLVVLGTVFFNAAGTAGNQIVGMWLNIVMMLIPAIFTGIISYLCTLYNTALLTNPSLYSNGTGVIASIAFAISVFVTAYVRLKYPRLYIPALQGFTMPFFVLTKGIYNTEFDIMNVVGTFYPVLIGGALALLCNLFFWPETAAKASELAFGNSIERIKSVLSFVHQDLLKNDNAGVMTGDISTSSKLQALNGKLQKDISTMKSARQDAKYEIIVSYYAPEAYKPLLNSISALAENLLGFSLSIKREVRIMLEKKVKAHLQRQQHVMPLSTPETQHDIGTLSGDTLLHGREYKDIDRLQSHIQPSLKRFLSTCISALDQIERDLIEHKAITTSHQIPSITTNKKVDLVTALEEFKETELTLQHDYNQVGAIPTEDHFLIFTIIFTMVQFGQELISLQQQAHKLISSKDADGWWFQRIHLPKVELTHWLNKAADQKGDGQSASEKVILDHRDLELKKLRQQSSPHQQSSEDHEEDRPRLQRRVSMIVSRIETRRQETYTEEEEVEEEEVQNTTPLQNVRGKHWHQRTLYSLTKWFQYGPTRYAIKLTLIMQLLSLMAYLPIDGVNQFYNDNHGQWALLSAMVVINYTVGSTSIQCFYRVVATICGAVCGYISLVASNRDQNPYITAVLVLVFQIPMWYLLLGSPYPRIGFISLLTMGVIVSTGYTNSLDESIFAPVWKRTITAILAIIVVMLVDQLIWPVWARKRVRTGLADLLIATGIQYSRVVSLVCQANTKSFRYVATYEESRNHQKNLTRQMQVVSEMLVLARDEPRLTKGPFPIKEYQAILEHERNILYWIQHIYQAQALISETTRQSIMNPLNAYRKEMAAAVHLYLFTLACALRTKSSLPASLPSAEMARRMLQQKQIYLWKEHHQQKTHGHKLFWHTYAAGCTEVVVEQEAMGEVVTRLMGQYVFQAATKNWMIPDSNNFVED